MVGQKRTGSREGGVEVVVGELASRMAALGHQVTCYDRSGAGALREPYEWCGVHVVPVRTIDARGLAAASSSYFAMRAAVKNGSDVVHVHAEGPCAMLNIAHRAGVRTVATIHGLDWQRAKWGGFAGRFFKHGVGVAARLADAVNVLSKTTQDYFLEKYGRKTKFVPNGIAVPTRRPPLRLISERWGLSEGSYVLYLGRIVPEKGLHYLIDAYKHLDTDKRLVVAGASSDTDNYVARIRKQADGDSRILFTGFVEGEELAELYSGAYVYCLPSDVEGMPMSLLEAMAYGCACVTSDIPGCADVLAGTGTTFSKGDTNELAAALDALFSDPSRVAALGAAAREHVSDTYDWNAVVARTLELYEGGAV